MSESESIPIPTREQNNELFDSLRQSVEKACDQSRKVQETHPMHGLNVEFIQDAQQQKSNLDNNEVLSFTFHPDPHTAFVDNLEDYPMLLMVSLRELLKRNHDLTEEELDSEEFQDFYHEWYQTNLDHHFFHEKGHLQGAIEHTPLICHLGVEFYVNPEGTFNFRPIIDFDGQVESSIYREFVVNGPDELSRSDIIVNGA